MSDTRQRILDDIKLAMKAGDKPRVAALRLVAAAIKQQEVDARAPLDETSTVALLDKLLKQRRESVEQYEKAGRDDLAARERAEAELIGGYLPAALDQEEIDRIVERAIADAGAGSMKDMGRVMAALKPALQGRADMTAVSRQVKARLGA